jgi:hypothetical protein
MITNIHTNIMGTISFSLKAMTMRKAQEFIVYPIAKNDEAKIILIQSDTRIGRIDLKSGKGIMSQPHSSGAYAHHLSIDKLTAFELSPLDTQSLRMAIFTTADEKAGTNGVMFTDNSGAIKAL